MAESAVLDTIHAAATFWAIRSCIKLQELAVKHFLLGRDVFVTFRLVVASPCVIKAYLLSKAFDELHKTTESCSY